MLIVDVPYSLYWLIGWRTSRLIPYPGCHRRCIGNCVSWQPRCRATWIHLGACLGAIQLDLTVASKLLVLRTILPASTSPAYLPSSQLELWASQDHCIQRERQCCSSFSTESLQSCRVLLASQLPSRLPLAIILAYPVKLDSGTFLKRNPPVKSWAWSLACGTDRRFVEALFDETHRDILGH